MKLFEPINDKGRTPYCGPSAISILTGVPISRAEFSIRRRRRGGYRDAAGRRRPIKGAYNSEVIKCLRLLGCKVKRVKTAEPTLARFVEDTRHAGVFLVNVTHHYVVTHAGMIADNGTGLKPQPFADFRKPLWRVTAAWRVEAPAEPRYKLGDPLGSPGRKAAPRPPLRERRAAKIAADLKRWERKAKLAKTKIAKLRRQARYYAKALTAGSPIPAEPGPAGAC